MKQTVTLERGLKILVSCFFGLFLFLPLARVLQEALLSDGRLSFHLVTELVGTDKWLQAFLNSFCFALSVALVATLLGFLLAYGLHFTKLAPYFKQVVERFLVLPMLLPTITYGFVLIYSFGKQGLWTRIFGRTIFDIYGTAGVFLGLLIYCLPVTFVLFNDAMHYLDHRFFIVSRLMRDHFFRGFQTTVLQPLLKVFAISLVQAFFMSFTDFGIPVAVGGQKVFITTLLYEYFLGSLPDFARGSVIALSMLLPSILSVICLHRLQKIPVAYEPKKTLPLKRNRVRDSLFAIFLSLSAGGIMGIFFVMFLIPFVASWPYQMQFSLTPLITFSQDPTLRLTLQNSLLVAILTASFGTLTAFLAAVFTTRSQSSRGLVIDSFAMITNSLPGMVLGIAYLLIFSGTPLHNTLFILVAANLVHYFATPYQLAKSALQKMNPNWENTAKIMGDYWLDTLLKVIVPNAKITIIEMFSYYFTNAMVTISAVVFLTSAETMVMTTKIKELQHFGRFTDIFILSIILLAVNSTMRMITQLITRRLKSNEQKIEKNTRRVMFNRNTDTFGSLRKIQR